VHFAAICYTPKCTAVNERSIIYARYVVIKCELRKDSHILLSVTVIQLFSCLLFREL